MKARLIKQGDRYVLYAEGGHKIACTSDSPHKKLSLKNCEAIANGYDLDELVKGFIERTGYNDFDSYSYKLGFQKALELMGDKKFSEEDVMLGWDAGTMSQSICSANFLGNKKELEIKKHRESYQKDLKPSSLQQTEWDVEIEMEEISHYKGSRLIDEYRVNKLDSDGCLILKRLR